MKSAILQIANALAILLGLVVMPGQVHAQDGNPFRNEPTTAAGHPTWDSDMIDIEASSYTGAGVYVAVLDTGLAPSVIFVIVLYILVATVTVGNLPVNKIVEAKDYALAIAAKPFLGQFGFILISIAALLSTTSAINATFYGSARLSYIIAKDGELPRFLEDNIWNKPIEGLIITSVATLIFANLFDLSSLSTMGSAGFLLIFACVNLSNAKLYKQTKSKIIISWIGADYIIILYFNWSFNGN